jgi:viroplasmin and RNaseH domain-containing protein
MMGKAKKIYAVREGRKVGLFDSWAECERQIKGYSGAEYKSFADPNEARKYLGHAVSTVKTVELPKEEMFAYVDGSYSSDTGEYSAGIVILYRSNKKVFSMKDNDPMLSKMRNVAGEIMGAKAAMKYAVENNVANLVLYYDYAGIEKWCTGEWQTKMDGTKYYKEFYDDISKSLTISFVKVKAHSGDIYNEEADKLARQALSNLISKEKSLSSVSDAKKSVAKQKFDVTLFIKRDQVVISDKDLLHHFKNIWKKRGEKLKDLKKLDLILDVTNNEYNWKASTNQGIKQGSAKLVN